MTTQTSVNNQFTSSDLTVENAFIGSTISATVTNTDNSSTSSQAYVKTLSGGGSGGDPIVTFTITGQENYTLGNDNSDSDSLIMSNSTALGTTNVARCSSAGEWTYFNRPALLATGNGVAVNNVSGDNTVWGPATLPTEIFDKGSDYDNATYTYTFPADGLYLISAAGQLNNGANLDYISVYIYTSNVTSHVTVNAGIATYKGCCNSQLFYCDLGDTAYVQLASGTNAKDDDFSGLAERQFFSIAMVA